MNKIKIIFIIILFLFISVSMEVEASVKGMIAILLSGFPGLSFSIQNNINEIDSIELNSTLGLDKCKGKNTLVLWLKGTYNRTIYNKDIFDIQVKTGFSGIIIPKIKEEKNHIILSYLMSG